MYSKATEDILIFLKDNGIVPIKVIDKDPSSVVFNDLIEIYLAKNDDRLLELVITSSTTRLVSVAKNGSSHTYFITNNISLSQIVLIQTIITSHFGA